MSAVLDFILGFIVGILGVVLLWFVILFVSSLFVKKGQEYDKNSKYYRFLLNMSTTILLKVMRIHTTIIGEDRIPKDGRFLAVCNHRSNYDPLITWTVFQNLDLAFISKPENFEIPFFGKIIQKCCFMAIDRKNPLNANITKKRAAKLIESGEVNVLVYPEGTRSRTGKMLPFHNGVLNIAKDADCPVVVMCMQGTADVKKNFPKRSEIIINVCDIIPVETVRELTPHDLGERSKAAMLEILGE